MPLDSKFGDAASQVTMLKGFHKKYGVNKANNRFRLANEYRKDKDKVNAELGEFKKKLKKKDKKKAESRGL